MNQLATALGCDDTPLSRRGVERRFEAACTEALESKLWRDDLDLWVIENVMPDSIQR